MWKPKYRAQPLFCLSVMVLGVLLSLSSVVFAEVRFLQVEGMVLGFYPKLAEGVRVAEVPNSKEIKFELGNRCLEPSAFEKIGMAYESVNYEAQDLQKVRNKMTGLIGYPGLSLNGMADDWLRSAHGLAAEYYKENLATTMSERSLQVVFVPMVLSPEPVLVTQAQWTPEAKKIRDEKGWAALEEFCGSHFVMAVGEEHYVVYSIRIDFDDEQMRKGGEERLKPISVSPVRLLEDLYRMRQRQEFSGYDSYVTVDVLQVGGRESDAEDLHKALADSQTNFTTDKVLQSVLTRAQIKCPSYHLAPCQQMTQIFIDYQFGRLNFTGKAPVYAPVRFRIAPLSYAKKLVQEKAQ